jgi:hypothetical protein
MAIIPYSGSSSLSDDQPLWRYMDFAKFLDLLETSTLYFAALPTFEDQFDGIHNALGDDDYYDIDDTGKVFWLSELPTTRQQANTDSFKPFFLECVKRIYDAAGISCWRAAERESYAMWKAFVPSGHGIAVKTNMKAITESLSMDPKERLIYGKVNYQNLDIYKTPVKTVFDQIFYKSDHFSHEDEVRLFYYCIDNQSAPMFRDDYLHTMPTTGKKLAIQFHTLITEIVVSPYAPGWFFSLVSEICAKRYGMSVKPTQSKIALRK